MPESLSIDDIPRMTGLHLSIGGPSPDGRGQYWMPPNPVADPRAVTTARRWIKYPELWDDRSRVMVNGIVPDGVELVRRNFETNAKLGRFEDWKELWGAERGKIAIMLGCGPSLVESLPEIRKLTRNRNKYFTIGMNRALTAHELDYYHIADRRGDRDWTDAERDYSRTTLLASPTVACQHPKRFKRRFWGEHFFDCVPDTGIARLSTEMCITACDTLHAAYKLGASEVWLYGCDFALSGQVTHDRISKDGPVGKIFLLEKYYHDVGAMEGMAIREGMFPAKPPVVGINGRLVGTTWELMCYAAYLSVMAHMVEHDGGVPVFNKTPCGIMTESWKAAPREHDIPDTVPVRSAEAG